MMLLAVLIPLFMLGALLALGRYEEALLPAEPSEATSVPAPAGTPASSP